jgi:tRNA modification GTPase
MSAGLADTIVAPATALAPASVAVLRLSGPDARRIAQEIIGKTLRPGLMTFAVFRTGGEEQLDQGYAVYLPAPATLTGEDVAELQCHGSVQGVQELLAACVALGARPAERGEFTLRAFLNGKLDLAQAEAVAELVAARTAGQRRAAVAGLRGQRAEPVRRLRAALLDTLAYLSARADFPDDDVPARDLRPELDEAVAMAEALLSSAGAGIRLRQGVRTAIVGPPNAGKSSLLNRLLRAERAIVTDVPGTTRDTLEELLEINGAPFVLVDTAGLRQGAEPVETLGIERALAEVADADLLLVVLDGSQPASPDAGALLKQTADANRIVVLNKSDLGCPELIVEEGVAVSARTGEGVAELERRMLAAADFEGDGTAAVSTARQRAALVAACAALEEARATLAAGLPEDLVSVQLREAVYHLGLITGESVTEDLLSAIFSRFCIGK